MRGENNMYLRRALEMIKNFSKLNVGTKEIGTRGIICFMIYSKS